jgi:hypothetical protein
LLAAPGAFGAPASIALPGDRVFSENITSTKDGTIYVGRLGSGGIMRIEPRSSHTEIWMGPLDALKLPTAVFPKKMRNGLTLDASFDG